MTLSDVWLRRLTRLRERLVALAERADRPELAEMLTGLPAVGGGDRMVRVVVAGETKRGKSTLVNSLVGRPLLSPVGVDVTTACWLELRYGDRDEAEVLLADPDDLGAPRRVVCELREIERFVTLAEVMDPVIGVVVRVRSALLRDLVLVDTPGVGGLLAGHSRTTLTALRRADTLLFVCDARQPILAPEVDFLIEAQARVPNVVVAVTKCDVNPAFEVVVDETRARIADRRALSNIPVFAVAAALADRAAEIEGPSSLRLAELSGIGPLVAALRGNAAAGSDAIRFANIARVAGDVARVLIASSEELAAQLSGDTEREAQLESGTERLSELLNDRARLTLMVQQHLAQLRTEPRQSFDSVVSALQTQYSREAESGPGAQLSTLAARMLADLTAAGTGTLETTAQESTRLVGRLLNDISGGVLFEFPMWEYGSFGLDLPVPQLEGRPIDASSIGQLLHLFSTTTQLLGGSALAIAVLGGPGVLAAGIAIAAGAGWWQLRGENEQQKRAQLRSWVDSAAVRARSGFQREIIQRVLAIEQHVVSVLPRLLADRRREMDDLRTELTKLRKGSDQTRRAALAAQYSLVEELRHLVSESEVLMAGAAPTPGDAREPT